MASLRIKIFSSNSPITKSNNSSKAKVSSTLRKERGEELTYFRASVNALSALLWSKIIRCGYSIQHAHMPSARNVSKSMF